MQRTPSRRLFLAGAGVTLALPFLPSALWSRRAGAGTCVPPRRFMAWFAPNGMVMDNWTPVTAGMGWAPSTILGPLKPIRNKMLVVTGLDHESIAVPQPSPTGTPPDPEVAGTGCFLNMVPVDGHAIDTTRTSLDQVLLPVLNGPDCGAPGPWLPSVQIGIDGNSGLCGMADCSFSRTISWKNGMALPCIYDPAQLFDAMFAGGTDIAARQAAARKSILDSVVAEAKSLSVTLSPSDRLKLDEHTTLVRNLETRLQRTGKTIGTTSDFACSHPSRPPSTLNATPSTVVPASFPLFTQLMQIAFACDITRSITFMIGSALSNDDYEFLIGASTPHHLLSSGAGSASSLAALTTIDTWEIQQAAGLLAALDNTMEADGKSVLDHTTFYMSSDIADGVAKNHWDMPVILAGGASGGLKVDGRHINYFPTLPVPRVAGVGPRNPNQNTGQVFISILHAHGILQDTFGLATGGPLPELMP